MKIKHKIILSFSVTIVLTGIILVFFSYFNYQTSNKVSQLRGYYSEMIDDAGVLLNGVQKINYAIEAYEIYSDDHKKPEAQEILKTLSNHTIHLENEIKSWENEFDSMYSKNEIPDTTDYNDYNQIKTGLYQYLSKVNKLISTDFTDSNNISIREAEKQIWAIAVPVEKQLKAWSNNNARLIDQNLKELNTATTKYFYLSVSIAILLVLVSVFAGLWVYRSINSPIENLKSCFHQISKGDFSSVDYSQKNEIGELIASFNIIASSLHLAKDELKSKNNELITSNTSLIKAKDKAEEADRLKSAFLANMSHEIRTPLNGIIGYADLLKNPNKTPEKQLRYVEMIKNSGKQLLHIINDILDISRIEAGTMKINETVFDLNQILEETRHFFIAEIKKRNKNIDIMLNKAYEKPLFIKCDEQRLRQILNNLIGNAIKFTNIGYIEVSYSIHNELIEFIIKDTGVGISDDNQKAVFDRFNQRTSDVAHREGGTGLGLSISKGLVEILGGAIWLESIEGQGSIFYFTVPFRPDENLNLSIDINQHISFNWENKTILIVEDNAINAEFISELLSETNVKIKYESSGAQAIERCVSDKSIDLVLMDIRLPDLDGYETTQVIKTYRPELPIIAQTAHASEEHRQKCIDAGCSDFISKPIEHNVLLSLLDKFLS